MLVNHIVLSVLGLIQCAQAYVVHLVQQVEVDGTIVETIDQMVETGDVYTTSNATDRAGYIFSHWSTSTVQPRKSSCRNANSPSRADISRGDAKIPESWREPVVRLFCIENRPVGSGFMQPSETATEHPTKPRGDMLYLET